MTDVGNDTVTDPVEALAPRFQIVAVHEAVPPATNGLAPLASVTRRSTAPGPTGDRTEVELFDEFASLTLAIEADMSTAAEPKNDVPADTLRVTPTNGSDAPGGTGPGWVQRFWDATQVQPAPDAVTAPSTIPETPKLRVTCPVLEVLPRFATEMR
jgi:hypothetical protein